MQNYLFFYFENVILVPPRFVDHSVRTILFIELFDRSQVAHKYLKTQQGQDVFAYVTGVEKVAILPVDYTRRT